MSTEIFAVNWTKNVGESTEKKRTFFMIMEIQKHQFNLKTEY